MTASSSWKGVGTVMTYDISGARKGKCDGDFDFVHRHNFDIVGAWYYYQLTTDRRNKMKVKDAIKMLETYQSPEDDVMVVWFGSSAKETRAHIWQKACEIWDADDKEIVADFMRDCIVDAEIFYEKRDMAELSIDSYLDMRAEQLEESVR